MRPNEASPKAWIWHVELTPTGEWQAREQGSSAPPLIAGTIHEAIERAVEAAKQVHGEARIVVKNQDGTRETSRTYVNDPEPSLSN